MPFWCNDLYDRIAEIDNKIEELRDFKVGLIISDDRIKMAGINDEIGTLRREKSKLWKKIITCEDKGVDDPRLSFSR